jgi:hypothetical protein
MDFWTIKRILEIGGYTFEMKHNNKTNGVDILVDSYDGDDFVKFQFDELGFLIPLK